MMVVIIVPKSRPATDRADSVHVAADAYGLIQYTTATAF
jgi:hypothetical protein